MQIEDMCGVQPLRCCERETTKQSKMSETENVSKTLVR
jgi:hypothetical protein